MANLVPWVNANHVAPSTGRYEPQRTNNFTIYLTPKQKGGAPQQGKDDILRLALDSFPMPDESSEVITVNFGNEKRYVAGVTTYSDETLTVNDYVDQEVATILRNWRQAVYDPETGEIGLAAHYKTQASVVMFGPGGLPQGFKRTWDLIGVWPKSLKFGEGKMDSPNQNKLTMVLKVDKILFKGQQGIAPQQNQQVNAAANGAVELS